jgi:hypothetical protein
LVDPYLVVTLGAQALQALRLIELHEVELAQGVRRKWRWYGRTLIPLYHPGQRAMIHRSFFSQLADYRYVAETYRRFKGQRKPSTNTTATTDFASTIVRQLLLACGPVTYFALHKLFYLLEYEHCRRTKRRMTTCYILRQKDGPYVVELNIKRIKKAIPELKIATCESKLVLSLDGGPGLFPEAERCEVAWDQRLRDVLAHVVSHYGRRSDDDLKRIVYLTSPMRQILRREKYHRENMFNAPIDFSVISS